MTAEAGFVERGFLEQLGTHRAVSVMTIGTSQLARADRMSRNLVRVGALLLVAGVADFWLCLLDHHLVARRMRDVTIVARDTIYLVLAGVPVGVFRAVFVAGETLRRACLILGQRIGAFLENDLGSGPSLGLGIALDVLVAFAVTTLARGRATIAAQAVLGLVERQDGCRLGLVMAAGAYGILLQALLSNRCLGWWRRAEVWQGVCSRM